MDRIEISSSPMRMLGLVMIGVIMTAGSAAMAVPLLPNVPPGSFVQFVGWIGLVFFGICTLVATARLVSVRGPVVTLAPEGIRDTRVAPEFIPWNTVRNISTWQSSGQKVMVLDVDPNVESRLNLTRIARWTRGANRSLGADGLCVTAQGLKMTYDDLLAQTIAFAERFRDSARAYPERSNLQGES